MKINLSKFPILETSRLHLRNVEKNDVLMIKKLRSDEVINKYIKRKKVANIQEAYDFIDRMHKDFENRENIFWAISLKNNSKMIGSICLWNFSVDGAIAEVGYALDSLNFNQGIMTEALIKTLDFGFNTLKLKRIEAYTHFQNEASKRILLKQGFTLNQERKDRENSDNLIYEKMNNSAKTKATSNQ